MSLQSIVEVLRHYPVGPGEPPDQSATAWMAFGFTPERVERWLQVDVSDAECAHRLEQVGVGPDDIVGKYIETGETVGKAFTDGQISIANVIAIARTS